MLGIFTILKMRGIYWQERLKAVDSHESQLFKPRMILATSYIIFGIGILFNFIIYFLIFILDPLPDKIMFNFLELFIGYSGVIPPEYITRVKDLESAKYPHERTIFYVIALFSFFSFLDIILSVFVIMNKETSDPKAFIMRMIGGLIGCILFGFNTFLIVFI
ncbi:unnamed protein product [marine sediment metagenome]|uniref:Uncharacterized protein n=1 Tax=marine sediment metagenome TaxID=412755 RepID=X0S577_9ZZZZ